MKNRGVTLVEMILISSVLGIVSIIFLKHLDLLKGVIFQNIQTTKLEGISEVNSDILQTVRSAQRIISVSDDKLELAIFNNDFKPMLEGAPASWTMDRRWIEMPKKVVYRWDSSQAIPRIMKDFYSSTFTTTVLNSKELYKDEAMVPPGPDPDHLFKPMYVNLNTGRIGGVAIRVRIRSPFFKKIRTPSPVEAAIYGKEF